MASYNKDSSSLFDAEDYKVKLAELLLTRYRRGGYKTPDADTLVELTKDVSEMLIKSFPHISLSELEEALENGFSGKYGEFRAGIYADKVLAFVRAYRSEKGLDNKVNCQNHASDHKRPITEYDIKDLLSVMYNLHCSGQVVSYCGGLLFDDLFLLGMIDYDTPPREYIDRAINKLKELKPDRMRKGNEFDRASIIKELAQLDNDNEEVIVKAKDLYVIDYFDSLKLMGEDIRCLLENRHINEAALEEKNRRLGLFMS